MDNLSKFFVILASSTYAAMNTKFQSDTGTLVVGTLASVNASSTQTFTSDTGGSLVVGTLASLNASDSTKFASDVPNSRGVVGTTGTFNSTVNTGMPTVASSSTGTAVLGTISNVVASVNTGMPTVASSSTGTAVLGTISSVTATVSAIMPTSTSASEMYREPLVSELPPLETITYTSDISFSSVSLMVNGES